MMSPLFKSKVQEGKPYAIYRISPVSWIRWRFPRGPWIRLNNVKPRFRGMFSQKHKETPPETALFVLKPKGIPTPFPGIFFDNQCWNIFVIRFHS